MSLRAQPLCNLWRELAHIMRGGIFTVRKHLHTKRSEVTTSSHPEGLDIGTYICIISSVKHLFMFHKLRIDKKIRYEKISLKTYYNFFQTEREAHERGTGLKAQILTNQYILILSKTTNFWQVWCCWSFATKSFCWKLLIENLKSGFGTFTPLVLDLQNHSLFHL